MAELRTVQKCRYNQRAYVQHQFRVRIDSDLADRVAAYKEEGHSLNLLVTRLLCDYFRVELPHRWYREIRRERLWPPEPEATRSVGNFPDTAGGSPSV